MTNAHLAIAYVYLLLISAADS